MNFLNTNKETPLKIITLSGTESVTKNMTLYEYGDDIIIVDCGVGFPDADLLGVNVVIPDFSYVLENSHKIRGLFVSHGHEDHLGAVPFLLEQLDVPIYTSKLVQGFLQERLSEKPFKHLAEKARFHIISPDSGPVSLGTAFKVEAFGINHSVPSSFGLAIRSPQGIVLHMQDFKIDWTPVLDKPIDLVKIAGYAKEGVLCLLSDCLNVTTEGYSKSESTLNDTFATLFENAENRQVFVTTISSNLSRMHQIISAAQKHGRHVVISGRSIEQSVAVGRRLGYLPFDNNLFVAEEDASRYLQGDLVYIIAGCYGQEGSALSRVARGEHKHINLETNAMVVFSADPNPPGVELDVEKLMSILTIAGAEVIYSKIQDNLHVSGHGPRGDLMTIAAVVKPQYFIPIGGTITRMRVYSNMVRDMGINNKERVFECMEGDVIEFSKDGAKRAGKIATQPVYIDANKTGEVNPVVIKDRDLLSTDGVFVVVVPMSKSGEILADRVDVVTRGFIYVKGSQELMDKSRKFIAKEITKNNEKAKDWQAMKRKLENEIEYFLRKETSKAPMVIVHAVTI